MEEFVAHLHPLLVHLPIGILLLAALFAWMGRRQRHAPVLAALPLVLRLGAAVAVFSCFSGWLLGGTGEYDPDTLQWHQWLGIATAAVAILACIVPQKLFLTSLAALLLVVTGHFGGTMTHGEGYLTKSILTGSTEKKRPQDVQEAGLYGDIIALIFEEKCITCHGSTKQKGGLRLDQPVYVQKGGKNGDVLHRNNTNDGELLRRCMLPLGHEDHMPPKEKPQLSPDELEILRWWLAEGADFQRKAKEVPQTLMVQKALANWQHGDKTAAAVLPDVPEENVEPASIQIVERLRKIGLLVLPVSRDRNWLSVSFVNLPSPADSVLALLENIAPQMVWLNMDGCTAPESAWPMVGKLSKLTRLSLRGSSVSDTALVYCTNLTDLQYLNLAQTQVTGEGIRKLSGLKALRSIFLFKTSIETTEWPALQAIFPQTKLDTGGYVLPFLETDTARKKMEKSY